MFSDSDESRVWISAIRVVSSACTRSARRSFGSHFATHSDLGCTHAPRPGSLLRPSGIATPCSATIRTKRRGSSRSRQPRHVRMLASLPQGTLGRVCRSAPFVEGEQVRRASVQFSHPRADADGRVLPIPLWAVLRQLRAVFGSEFFRNSNLKTALSQEAAFSAATLP